MLGGKHTVASVYAMDVLEVKLLYCENWDLEMSIRIPLLKIKRYTIFEPNSC